MGILDTFVDKLKEKPETTGKWVKGKYAKTEPTRTEVFNCTIVFEVAGIYNYKENISKLATPMKKWSMTDEQLIQKYPGKKIYKNYYANEPLQLVYEPTNPYDPNAIKVFINNLHVGYVPKEQCTRIKQILETGAVTITATVSGGDSKIIYANGIKEEYSEPMNIKIRVTPQR